MEKIKEIVRKILSADDTKMKKHFKKRTQYHINLVNKYLDKIADLHFPEIDNDLLKRDSHDKSKFEEPEYTPYLHVNWKNKLKDEGKIYTPSKEIEENMLIATFHHVKHNKHHPEFWDDTATLESINPKDRDSAPEKMVNATKMPLTHVAQMVADWTAMNEEKNKDKNSERYSAKDWADKNINVRWMFSPTQVKFIYKIIGLI